MKQAAAWWFAERTKRCDNIDYAKTNHFSGYSNCGWHDDLRPCAGTTNSASQYPANSTGELPTSSGNSGSQAPRGKSRNNFSRHHGKKAGGAFDAQDAERKSELRDWHEYRQKHAPRLRGYRYEHSPARAERRHERRQASDY